MLAARDVRTQALPVPQPTHRPRAVSPRAKAKPRPMSKPLCAALLLTAVCCAFMMANRHSTLVRLGYEAKKLAAELTILQKENAERAVRVASLGSLGRVQTMAQAQLGMIRPASNLMLVMPAPTDTAVGQLSAGLDPGRGADGALVRLWRLLVRLATSPAEAARVGP